jgi:signal transduction histidine kinase
VSELRPRRVSEDGLVPTLRQHFAIRERRDGLQVRFTVEGEECGGAGEKEALFRTVQESLNNVVKHAGVKSVAVSLLFGESVMDLRIRDEGRGFDMMLARESRGFGLSTMRERIESRGGRFRIISAPGTGTQVDISVPLEAKGGRDGQG